MAITLTAVAIAALLLGIGIGRTTAPRRAADPKMRQLLDDYASATAAAMLTTDVHDPNLLNAETKTTFSSLRARYIKELNK